MKTKYIVLLFFSFFCVSCDLIYPFIIEGEKEYITSNDCGTIVIKASSMLDTRMQICCEFNGDYLVNTDLLKVESASNEDTISDLIFYLNNEILTEKIIKPQKNDEISLFFSLKSTIPYKKSSGILLILPSNFITCDGKPILNDTIEMYLKK